MLFHVYLIKTIKGFKNKSYVGFTNNIKSRLAKHNSNKGAKATKGYKWELVYKRSFKNKSKALSYEYKLKKDRVKRIDLINGFDKKNIKIATVLPYKENYTFNKASAASLWVSEFYKKSKYRSANHIYGHTKIRIF